MSARDRRAPLQFFLRYEGTPQNSTHARTRKETIGASQSGQQSSSEAGFALATSTLKIRSQRGQIKTFRILGSGASKWQFRGEASA